MMRGSGIVFQGISLDIEENIIQRNKVNIQSKVCPPLNMKIRNPVSHDTSTILTTERYPPFRIGRHTGPGIHDRAATGVNATILSRVEINYEGGTGCSWRDCDKKGLGLYTFHRIPDTDI